VVATVRSIRRGWLPIGDTAAISARSWDVLTNHGVFVGQRTAIAGVYDLGPLEYWLLTLPVHLDPDHGSLWGAALCCIVAASLAIEAARSAFGALGAVAASAAVLGTVAWMPSVALGPTWNPHFGDLWYLTVLASASAVLGGQRRWWPVLVLSASVAAQAHLMFAAASLALVLLGGGVELLRSYRFRSGHGWVAGGFVLGIACWVAPLVQEVSGHPGNLIALLDHRPGHAEGLMFGLRALGAATTPPPVWWSGGDVGSHAAATMIGTRSPLLGLLALAVLVGLSLLAWASRDRRLIAVSSVAVVASAGLVVTFANVPTNSPFPPYLLTAIFPVGALAWMALVGGLVVGGRRVRHGVPADPEAAAVDDRQAASSRPTIRRSRRDGRVAYLALLPLAAVAALALGGQANEFPRAFAWGLVPIVRTASLQIEHAVGRGPVQVEVLGAHGTTTYGVMAGMAARLEAAGYRPQVTGFEALASLGPAYLVRAGSPTAHVTVRGAHVSTTVTPPK